MKNTLRLLMLLGVIAQAIALSATWYELGAMLRGDVRMDVLGTALLVLPSILGFGGAAAARALHRRGSAGPGSSHGCRCCCWGSAWVWRRCCG
jgi:hypothetical protein